MSEPKKKEDKDEEEIEEKEAVPKTADAQDQAKALQRVQVAGKERQLDDTKVNQNVFKCYQALSKLTTSSQAQRNAAEEARLKELQAVQIKTADVDLIESEMEIPRDKAEKILRENKGSVVAALRAIINQ